MSKSEEPLLDFEKICRLCLLEKRCMSSIFAKKKSDKKVPLAVRIMSCAALELYEGDGLPASICSKCLLSVNQSYAFKEQCEQADSTLRQYAQRMNEARGVTSSKKPPTADFIKMKLESRWERPVQEISEEGLDLKAFKDDEGEFISDRHAETSSAQAEVPPEVFVTTDTVSEIRLPKENSFEELFKKLLTKKESTVEKKNSTESLITDNEEKLSIIKKLSLCARDRSVEGKMEDVRLVPSSFDSKSMETVKDTNTTTRNSVVFCKECNIFLKHSSCAAHNRFVHRKIKKYLCQTCGYAAPTGSILRQHIQAVHVGYTFECDKCFRKFNLLKRLRKHKESCESKTPVAPKKSLLCHYCGLNFSKLSYLKIHFLTHTGEAPLQCQYCDRRFKFRWARIQHERLHTGVKPYKCEFCDERFTQNRMRKIHECKVHRDPSLKTENDIES